jgi:hypothetical protein
LQSACLTPLHDSTGPSGLTIAHGRYNSTLGGSILTYGGGGIENNRGVLHIADSIINGNIAQGGVNVSGPGGDVFGGSIINTNKGVMTVSDSRILDNSAIGGLGGAGTTIGTSGVDGVGFGGGIGTAGSATTTLVGCSIVDNVAQGSAGTNGNKGGDGLGGGLGVGGFALGGAVDTSQLTATDFRIVDNKALGGAGGQGANGGDGLGSGLAIVNGASATSPTARSRRTTLSAVRRARATAASTAKVWVAASTSPPGGRSLSTSRTKLERTTPPQVTTTSFPLDEIGKNRSPNDG